MTESCLPGIRSTGVGGIILPTPIPVLVWTKELSLQCENPPKGVPGCCLDSPSCLFKGSPCDLHARCMHSRILAHPHRPVQAQASSPGTRLWRGVRFRKEGGLEPSCFLSWRPRRWRRRKSGGGASWGGGGGHRILYFHLLPFPDASKNWKVKGLLFS